MNPRRRESTYDGHALHLRARRAQKVAMAIRLPCLLLLPLLATSGATAQESDITIYRCTDAAGHLTVQDSPCADDQPQQVRRMIQPTDPPPRAEPVAPAARAEEHTSGLQSLMSHSYHGVSLNKQTYTNHYLTH